MILFCCRHNICHTSPDKSDHKISANSTNLRHFSLQEFHSNDNQRLGGSHSDSSRHSSSSSKDQEDLEEVDNEEDVSNEDLVFEDNQPLLVQPQPLSPSAEDTLAS